LPVILLILSKKSHFRAFLTSIYLPLSSLQARSVSCFVEREKIGLDDGTEFNELHDAASKSQTSAKKDKKMKNAKKNEAPNESEIETPPELSVKEIQTLTKLYVAKLNEVGEAEANAWVALGGLIFEYLKKISPADQPKKNYYKVLAEDPNLAYSAQQLRNYAQAHKLYQELGGLTGAPKLPMTFFILVLPKRLTIFKKRQLLNRAVADKLSVSEFKAVIAVAARINNAKPAPKPTSLAEELRQFEVRAQTLYVDFVSLHDEAAIAKNTAEIQSTIQKALQPLFDFAKAHAYLTNNKVYPEPFGPAPQGQPVTLPIATNLSAAA